ncbi:MAG: RNA polymerase subunit sigma-70 [Desulfobacterium sp.]|nr:RNA polymerase subunit sigma-70 [Desulfobacterium sp.]
MNEELEQISEKAKQGSKKALDELIQRLQGRIYGLALRMLGFASDAEDATQEILIKIITHLSDFKGESRFTTWYYKIAINHLLTLKQYRAKDLNVNFDMWDELAYRRDPDFDFDGLPEPSKTLMAEEVRIGCMQGILQCLEPKLRITFILGEIMEMSGEEGADILGISAESFRKRLSRGRDKVNTFMQKHCSLVIPENECHCSKMVGPDIRDKWIDPDNLQFVGARCHAKIDPTVKHRLGELNEIGRVVVLYRSYPEYSAPDAVVDIVKEMIASEKYKILQH